MFAVSAMVGTGRGARSGAALATCRWDAADLGADAAPTPFSSEAGRDSRGAVGWRQIAACATGAEGPGFMVQLGISKNPDDRPAWRGGMVTGFISHAPDHRPLIEIAFSQGAPKPLMLVADTPPPGLEANAGPDLSAIPNNHLAYAVQWFLFAAVAVVIYGLALRKRWRAG